MKKKQKKLWIAASVFLLTFAGALGGCKDKEEGIAPAPAPVVESTETVGSVVVSQSQIELCVGGVETLTFAADGVQGDAVWSSSNANVVTVENGTVVARGAGSATVTVTVGGVTGTCMVGVLESMPLIECLDEIIIGVGEEFVLPVGVSLNGKAQANTAFSCKGIEGSEEVATAVTEGGECRIVGVASGETVYTVSAWAKGVEVHKNVTVKTVDNATVWMVGGAGIEALTGGYQATIALDTSLKPVVSVYTNDVLQNDVEFTWSSDDATVVAVDNEGNLQGLKEGSAKIVCAFEGNSIEFFVSVVRPTYTLATAYTLETSTAALTLTDSLSGSITGVTLDGKDVFKSASGKTIAFEEAALPTAVSEMGANRQLVVDTDKAIYLLTVDVCTKAIRAFSDLAAMNTNVVGELSGYYVLANDIINTENQSIGVVGYWSSANQKGFCGTLDGRGHTISNFTVNNGGGIFGAMYGAHIKDITFDKVSYTASSALFGYTNRAGKTLIENVTVNIAAWSETTNPRGVFFSRATEAMTYKNVVVNVADGLTISTLLGQEVNEPSTLGDITVNLGVGSTVATYFATSTTPPKNMTVTVN